MGERVADPVPVDGGQDGALDGDPECGADLAGGVVDGGPDAGVRLAHALHHRGGAGRCRQPRSHARDDLYQGEVRVSGLRRRTGQQHEGAGDHDETAHHDGPLRQPRGEHRRQRRPGGESGGQRQGAHPGLPGGAAQHSLQVKGDDEERAEHPERHHGQGRRRDGDRTSSHVPGQHRRRSPPQPQAEGRQQRGGEGGRGEDRRAGPSAAGAFDDRPDQRQQPRRGQHGARYVDGFGTGGRRRRDHEERQGDDPRGEGHVQPEHRPPGVLVDQPAADHGPQGAAQSAHRRPQRDGPPSPGRLREQAGEQRQRGGHDEGRARAHGTARRDQLPRHGGHRAGPGGAPAEGEAGDERASAADPVGDAPGRQHETAQDERVGVDDPLRLPRGRAEGGLQIGEGDIEHGEIHAEQEQSRADGPGAHPASPCFSRSRVKSADFRSAFTRHVHSLSESGTEESRARSEWKHPIR